MDLTLVAQTSTAAAALNVAPQAHPDVALLAVQLPDGSGFTLCLELLHLLPHLEVLLCCEDEHPMYVAEAWHAGATGLLLTPTLERQEFLVALRRTARHRRLFNPRQLAQLQTWEQQVGERVRSLTAREAEALRLVLRGQSNQEIALALAIALKIVEKHLAALFAKFDVHSRTQLVAFTREQQFDGRVFPPTKMGDFPTAAS